MNFSPLDHRPDPLTERWHALQARVTAVAAAAGRDPATVRILAVSKTQPAERVAQACRAGVRWLGENRVSEAAAKRPAVEDLLGGVAPPSWELIGHLQSNKARLAVATFARVQSLDRPKLVAVLARLAEERGRPLPVLLQVNAGRDPAKFGVEPEEAPALLDLALAEPALRVEGLMTIPPLSDDPAVADRTFATLAEIRADLVARTGHPLGELSMGMSSDWELAVRRGSTLLRLGTVLFGARPNPGGPA